MAPRIHLTADPTLRYSDNTYQPSPPCSPGSIRRHRREFPPGLSEAPPLFLHHHPFPPSCLLLVSPPPPSHPASPAPPAGFQVSPSQVLLEGNFARAQLIATATGPSDRAADLTHEAHYVSSDTHIVSVTPTGKLLAIA